MKIVLIAAVSANNVIGYKGKIPWHSKEELTFFKNTTMGFPVIMGKNTFLSIGKILPGRLNIVITSKNKPDNNNLKFFNSLEQAINYCKTLSTEKIFVIGGESVYNNAIAFADEIILSKMPFNVKGDKFFPEIKTNEWEIEKEVMHDNFITCFYKRKR